MTIVYRTDGSAIDNSVMDENFEQLSQRYEGSDIGSSATLSTTLGYTYFTVSGNTDISAIADVSIGQRIALKFTEAGGVIGHAAALLMPGSTTITWRANDTAIFVNEAAGVWRCVSYQRGDISPMGAALQTAGDNSTLAASTAYADSAATTAIAKPKWELLDTFTADGTAVWGENTAVQDDVVAIRVLINGFHRNTLDTTWYLYINLGDSTSYPITGLDCCSASANSVASFYTNSYRATINTPGGAADYTYGKVEFWNIQGTDTWIGEGTTYEVDDDVYMQSLGQVNLASVLTRIKLDAGGTDVIDAGVAEIWVLR